MIVLVLNSGSSSLKFQLLDMDQKIVMAKGLVERIGSTEYASFSCTQNDNKEEQVGLSVPDHTVAVALVVKAITEGENAVLDSLDQIDAIGQRVVQGGEKITESTLITEDVEKEIEQASEIAPLHNPAALAAIRACKDILPGIPQVGVFDTSFHSTIDESHYMYAIPYEDYKQYKVRRYGYHGTSHKYVAERAAELLGKKMEDLKIITCHLGNGASVSAIEYGKVIDTSMGFTPLQGLVMGTRVGDIDAAAVLYLMEQKGLDTDEMDLYLNKKSGLLGVSGISNDFRDIEVEMDKGNKRAQLAFDMFVLSVKRYIGFYMAEMNGADVLIFTAGIGENDCQVREAICADMHFLGLAIDKCRNDGTRKEAEITANHSLVRTFIIPTNEELAIARECVAVIGK